MPEDQEMTSKEEKGDDWIPPQEIIDDEEIPSEDRVERIQPNCKIPYSEICLLEGTGKILLFNKSH